MISSEREFPRDFANRAEGFLVIPVIYLDVYCDLNVQPWPRIRQWSRGTLPIWDRKLSATDADVIRWRMRKVGWSCGRRSPRLGNENWWNRDDLMWLHFCGVKDWRVIIWYEVVAGWEKLKAKYRVSRIRYDLGIDSFSNHCARRRFHFGIIYFEWKGEY